MIKRQVDRYLIFNQNYPSVLPKCKTGEAYLIIGELDILYFVWANGTCVAIPKYKAKDYKIITVKTCQSKLLMEVFTCTSN